MMINNNNKKTDNNKINNLQQIQNTKYNLRFFYIKQMMKKSRMEENKEQT